MPARAFHFYMIQAKICIIGAGPAGAAAALQLNKDGIDCILIDKARFPRDKVCGDGLSGKVLTGLKRIDPSITERLKKAPFKLNSWGVSFMAPNRKALHVGFTPNYEKLQQPDENNPAGYVCRRKDFDHFLIEEIKQCAHVQFFEGMEIVSYTATADGYAVTAKDGSEVRANLLIIANGAHSQFSKNIAGIQMEPEHFMAGVRAYYKNVSGNHKDNFIELHFLKSLLPGYFWIFPLPNGGANVGLGMLSKDVSAKKLNLKKELVKIIETDLVMKERFKNAELTSTIDGYGLPLGSKKRKLSGDHYMLTGDAASLIDPFSGEGIGNAIYSGRIAAMQAAKAVAAHNFSATFLNTYDAEIDRVMGKELQLSTRIQKLVRYPWLFNLLLNISAKNKNVKELMSSMFYEVDVRKKLTQPSFYIKMLLNR